LDFYLSCSNFAIGEEKSFTTKSWWPLDSTWFAHSSHAHWTEKAEDFFDKQLGELEGKKLQPLDAHSWHSWIQASSNLRCMNASLFTSSAAFLANLPAKP
jgi:GH15 family glucan-1,4-alpha-glucosidase